MKKILVLFTLLFSSQLHAQNHAGHVRAVDTPALYLGFSGGLNNNAGMIGINLDVPIVQKVSLSAGIGVGSWGFKFYGEGRYYFTSVRNGWAIGAGITHCTGIRNVNITVNTINGDGIVTINKDPQTNAFFAGYYFWKLHRKSRFFITFGGSVPLAPPQYDQTGGTPISNKGDRVIKFLAPGGVVAGFGFSFGI